jgi:hypothetical protein
MIRTNELEAVTQSFLPLCRAKTPRDNMTNPNSFEEKKATLINNLNEIRSSILE